MNIINNRNDTINKNIKNNMSVMENIIDINDMHNISDINEDGNNNYNDDIL